MLHGIATGGLIGLAVSYMPHMKGVVAVYFYRSGHVEEGNTAGEAVTVDCADQVVDATAVNNIL